MGKTGAWVPALWRLEAASVAEMGVRRKRHDADFRDVTLADMGRLVIRIDSETDRVTSAEKSVSF